LTLLGLHTGLRLGDLLHLDSQHVDLDAGAIRIPAMETRSGRDVEERTSPECRKILDEAVALEKTDDDENEAAAGGRSGRILDAYDLPTVDGLPNLAKIEESFRRACIRARVPIGGLDSLRRTFAGNCARVGVPFHTACRLVDWDDLNIVVRVYNEPDAALGVSESVG
jgi:integrase